MPKYSAGWITVPGKGRRWRTSEGEYMMQRPAGDAPGVMEAIQGAWAGADKALGGWLPGGGVANPASGAVRGASKAVLGGGVLSAVPRSALGDVAGAGGYFGIAATAGALNPALRKIAGNGGQPSVKVMGQQMDVLQSAHRYLGELGSGVNQAATFDDMYRNARGLEPAPRPAKGKMVDFGMEGSPVGPVYQPVGSTSLKGKVTVNQDTPAWIIAHEFGHAADHVRRPGSFATIDQLQNMPRSQQETYVNNARLRMTGASAGVPALFARPGDGNRSVLEAGAQGALLGLASNWDMLAKEARADIHGMRIAKNAGVPWNTKQNLAAKGSYVLGTAGPGFIQGAAGEVISRGVDQASRVLKDAVVDPALRSVRGGDSPAEQSLRKYGYTPNEYALDAPSGQGQPFGQGGLEVRKRHPIGSEIMRRWAK